MVEKNKKTKFFLFVSFNSEFYREGMLDCMFLRRKKMDTLINVFFIDPKF